MHVGALQVRLLLREARSLKDKRQVVRSIMDRLRNGFSVAVAEVEARDQWQVVVLGIVTVAEEAHHAKSTLDQIANALRSHPIAEFVSCQSTVEHWLGE